MSESIEQKISDLDNALHATGQQHVMHDALLEHLSKMPQMNELLNNIRLLIYQGLVSQSGITAESAPSVVTEAATICTDRQTKMTLHQSEILSLIAASKREGIEKLQLLLQAHMYRKEFDLSLQFLEQERHIKMLKVNIGGTRKILYFLYEITPAAKYTEESSHKNGSWDTEAVRSNEDMIWAYITHTTIARMSNPSKAPGHFVDPDEKVVSPEKIVLFINDKVQSKQPVTESEVKAICTTLFYDDKIEIDDSLDVAYTATTDSIRVYMSQRYGVDSSDLHSSSVKFFSAFDPFSRSDTLANDRISLDLWARHHRDIKPRQEHLSYSQLAKNIMASFDCFNEPLK